jgi:pimeloyl-ACP methyl ester carboxylesterase
MSAPYLLIHGAGDCGWYWHLVEAELRARGREVVAMDLPVDDDRAGLLEYAEVAVAALDELHRPIVVAQSFGGYVAPIVCARVRAEALVLVAAMVPAPRESAEQMLANTRFATTADPDDDATFYHDVDPELAKQAIARSRRQSSTPGRQPWPLSAWPDVPTRFLLCRDDRMFPAAWLRGVVRERLHLTPDELDSGHTPALSHPRELTDYLVQVRP